MLQAAAYVAGADSMVCIGGVQAIGAFAYGAGDIPKVDTIVGPGMPLTRLVFSCLLNKSMVSIILYKYDRLVGTFPHRVAVVS